jgi:hypothetical protein
LRVSGGRNREEERGKGWGVGEGQGEGGKEEEGKEDRGGEYSPSLDSLTDDISKQVKLEFSARASPIASNNPLNAGTEKIIRKRLIPPLVPKKK